MCEVACCLFSLLELQVNVRRPAQRKGWVCCYTTIMIQMTTSNWLCGVTLEWGSKAHLQLLLFAIGVCHAEKRVPFKVTFLINHVFCVHTVCTRSFRVFLQRTCPRNVYFVCRRSHHNPYVKAVTQINPCKSNDGLFVTRMKTPLHTALIYKRSSSGSPLRQS